MSVSAITSQLYNNPLQLQNLSTNQSLFSLGSQTAQPSTGSISNLGATNSLLSTLASLRPQSILASEFGNLETQLDAGNLAGAQQAYSAFKQDLGLRTEHGPLAHSHPHPVAWPLTSSSPNANASSSPV